MARNAPKCFFNRNSEHKIYYTTSDDDNTTFASKTYAEMFIRFGNEYKKQMKKAHFIAN